MLEIAQNYVKEHNISFSTNFDASKSKSKGIVFSRKPLDLEPAPLILDGNPLPCVKSAKYLGNEIENIPRGLAKDTQIKWARYIERNVELNQEFPFSHPVVKCKLNRIYNSSFPGSVLYDLTSDPVKCLVNSWSTSVRQMWNLPVTAHRYLLEPLSGEHAFSMIITRFVKFLQKVQKSEKLAVQFMLAKVICNVRSVTGNNVRYIQGLSENFSDILKISPKSLKRKLSYFPIDMIDQWRVDLIREVTDIKSDVLHLEKDGSVEKFLSNDDVSYILNFVSSN